MHGEALVALVHCGLWIVAGSKLLINIIISSCVIKLLRLVHIRLLTIVVSTLIKLILLLHHCHRVPVIIPPWCDGRVSIYLPIPRLILIICTAQN